MEYDNTNKGSLFKNDRKEQDTHADYNGSINIEGKEYWLNAWVKESKKDGKKFFGLSAKSKDQASGTPHAKAKSAPARAKDLDGDDIPF
jgi:hypothetical protein